MNKIGLDSKEKSKLDEKDWEKKQFSIQQNISYISFKVEIKWNKEGE